MIKNSPICPAFAASTRTKHSLWALIDEEDAGKIDILMKKRPPDSWLKGLTFEAYLQKSSDDPIVPGEEEKEKNNMKRRNSKASQELK